MELKTGIVPALVDTGAEFSCTRTDVVEYFRLRDEPCKSSCASLYVYWWMNKPVGFLMLQSFAWASCTFRDIMNLTFWEVPVILGLDFLQRTLIRVVLPSSTYIYVFALISVGPCLLGIWVRGTTPVYNVSVITWSIWAILLRYALAT
jgi:hypothetical protein